MQLIIGVTWTKAQLAAIPPLPTIVYYGYKLGDCKAAIRAPIDAGTATKGAYLTSPHTITTRRNPAGTL